MVHQSLIHRYGKDCTGLSEAPQIFANQRYFGVCDLPGRARNARPSLSPKDLVRFRADARSNLQTLASRPAVYRCVILDCRATFPAGRHCGLFDVRVLTHRGSTHVTKLMEAYVLQGLWSSVCVRKHYVVSALDVWGVARENK